jgi:hypothetical protein
LARSLKCGRGGGEEVTISVFGQGSHHHHIQRQNIGIQQIFDGIDRQGGLDPTFRMAVFETTCFDIILF